jgi:hypothetical protein
MHCSARPADYYELPLLISHDITRCHDMPLSIITTALPYVAIIIATFSLLAAIRQLILIIDTPLRHFIIFTPFSLYYAIIIDYAIIDISPFRH